MAVAEENYGEEKVIIIKEQEVELNGKKIQTKIFTFVVS